VNTNYEQEQEWPGAEEERREINIPVEGRLIFK
jgi:hypothetical protein